MHEYDVTLKNVLTHAGAGAIARITGSPIERWHNVELPETRNLRVDLLGETATGDLIHMEIQRSNDPEIIWRMIDYGSAIRRKFGKWPQQCVLYVGDEPLRMPGRFDNGSIAIGFRLTDVRDLDGEALLASPCLEDNILAILTRLHDQREAVKRIVQAIAASEPSRHAAALKELTFLGGLRKLGSVIIEEAGKVPVFDDIIDHDLLGPVLLRGRVEGREEGRVEGREEGRVEGVIEGERRSLRRLIEQRFGPLPAWARERLDVLTAPQIEQSQLLVLNARSLDDILR